MEWIRIGSHKLKITLSAEDAARYALNCQEEGCADTVTGSRLRKILTDVEQETGFEANDDRIYIQMYPSKTGGCELFVTRMGLAVSVDPKDGSPLPQDAAEKPPLPKKRTCALRFTELEPLLSLCRRMAKDYTGESCIRQDDSGHWWLLLTKRNAEKSARELFRFAREYGQWEDADRAQIFLSEHGKTICDSNAVQTFARF